MQSRVDEPGDLLPCVLGVVLLARVPERLQVLRDSAQPVGWCNGVAPDQRGGRQGTRIDRDDREATRSRGHRERHGDRARPAQRTGRGVASFARCGCLLVALRAVPGSCQRRWRDRPTGLEIAHRSSEVKLAPLIGEVRDGFEKGALRLVVEGVENTGNLEVDRFPLHHRPGVFGQLRVAHVLVHPRDGLVVPPGQRLIGEPISFLAVEERGRDFGAREVIALQVLRERLVVGGVVVRNVVVDNDLGHGGGVDLLQRAPAALADHDHVPAIGVWRARSDGLQLAVGRNVGGELENRLRVELTSGLLRIRIQPLQRQTAAARTCGGCARRQGDGLDGKVSKSGAAAGHAATSMRRRESMKSVSVA